MNSIVTKHVHAKGPDGGCTCNMVMVGQGFHTENEFVDPQQMCGLFFLMLSA